MGYTAETVADFAAKLSSKAPTPGGGGACALVGALGIALGSMVSNLTIGKKKYADVEEEMISLREQADALRCELLELIEKDAELFEPLAKAYSLPKNTPEEIAEKERVMAQVLRDACSVPLSIMKKCCRAIDLIELFAQKGSVIAVSDAGDAAALCGAALRGAALNVYINTKSMKDRDQADALNLEADRLLKTYGKKADAVYAEVREKLRES